MPAVAVSPIGTTALGGESGLTKDPPVITGVAATTSANTSANSTVTWSYSQPQGRAHAEHRGRAQNTGGTTTYHDSGGLAGAGTSYTVDIDDAGIPVAATNKWVVHTRDEAGTISPAASANATYAWGNPQAAMATVEGVTVPADARMTITQATNITLTWTFSDGGNTQSFYRVRVLDQGTAIQLHDSGWTAGAGTTYEIPFTFDHGMTYEFRLQLKNNYGVRST